MNSLSLERRSSLNLPRANVVITTDNDVFGLKAALETLRRHWRPAATCFALVMLGTLIYGLLAVPVYKADTLVQIDMRARTSLLPGLGTQDRPAEGERPVAAGEIEILRSREVLMPVIEATGADIVVGGARQHRWLPIGARHGVRVKGFYLPAPRRGEVLTLFVAEGRWRLVDAQERAIAQGAVGQPERFVLNGEEAMLDLRAPEGLPETRLELQQLNPMKAYEAVLERLRIFEPSRESQVLRVSFEDQDPERAAAFLNGMVTSYLERAVQRRVDEGEKARAFLEAQLPTLKAQVEAAEETLASYQTKRSAVPLGTEAEALTRQRGELERQLIDLQIKRDSLRQTLTPSHPEMAAVLAQLANVQRTIARLGTTVGQLPAQQRDLLRLQRDLQIQTQQYTSMLEHVQQLRIAGASWLPSAHQLDRAAVPVEPVRPRSSAVTSIGVALATVLALLAALIARSMRTTITTVEELEVGSVAPTLATVPQSPNQQLLMDGRLREAVPTNMGTHRLLARAAPQDPAIESLRTLQVSLLQRARTAGAQLIFISSPSYGAGNAFVACNLAALLAENGKRVALVETDLRQPAVYRYVELDQNVAGLSDVLHGTHDLDQVINRHVSAGLDAILHGTVIDNPGGLLLAMRLAETLGELRRRYDHIVLHGSPLLPVGDGLTVARFADCALLVVRSEQSRIDEAQEAARRLARAGIPLEGMIFNGVRPVRPVTELVVT